MSSSMRERGVVEGIVVGAGDIKDLAKAMGILWSWDYSSSYESLFQSGLFVIACLMFLSL